MNQSHHPNTKMVQLIKYWIILIGYWLLYFFALRCFFILYQMPFGNRIAQKTDVLLAIIMGYQLDIATAAILSGIPFLLALVGYIFPIKQWQKITSYTIIALLLLYASIAIADAGIYKELATKINIQTISHFKNPSEIIKTISIPLQITFVAVVALFVIPFQIGYKQKIQPLLAFTTPIKTIKKIGIALFLLPIITALSIIIIRGGITNLPISQSVAYFSTSNLANNMAVNPMYNLLQDATVQSQTPNAKEYQFLTQQEAQTHIQEYLQVKKDTTIPILNTTQPNIVFIILESWSADEVGCLGGIKNATPHFDSLSKEGILCKNAYASAYISDQGVPSILSAFPGLNRIAIISQPDKINKLHSIAEDLQQQGYTSTFIYGGDLVFSNIKGYLIQKQFQNIIDYKTLAHLPQGQLGVHDEFTFPELLKQCNQSKQPFLNSLFTLSTHMPYDFHRQEAWKGVENDAEQKYSEAIHYADKQIGLFFSQAKKQTWYNNTLFVLVADHSHNTYKQTDPTHPGS